MTSKLPFSFVYNRRHSECLLPDWHRDGDTWTDPSTGLRVEWHKRLRDPAVEWYLTFTNTGWEPTPILEQVNACRVQIPGGPGWRRKAKLHRLNGTLSQEDDWMPTTKVLRRGAWERFGPRHGKSSSGACPFFTLTWGDKGVITAIGWTGQWRASIPWGTMCEIRAGMQRMHLSLNPGESIRTPSIMQLWFEGDQVEARNQFRQVMLEHIYPRVEGELVTPPLAHLSTAGYEWNDSDEMAALEHFESIKDLGFEVFWMDAYYLREDGFPWAIGNYRLPPETVADPHRYPSGMAHLGIKAHEAGMEWLMWYDVERVSPGTFLEQDHPEWLLEADGQEAKLLNLGNPEAREFMTNYLIETIDAHLLDWLRLDPCISYWPFWQGDPKHRVGITEIRYIEGLWKMLDDIREERPHIKLDNCGGGGRRMDLEMCKRMIPLWRTDHATSYQEITNDYDGGAIRNQNMITGMNMYAPLHSGGALPEQPYWFRSALNMGLGFLEDMRGEFYPREDVKLALAEAKRIRKYFLGDFYPLTDVTRNPHVWHAVQYHLGDEGMVLAFRRHKCTADVFFTRLNDIDPDEMYEVVKYHGYEHPDKTVMSGSMLQAPVLYTDEKPGSVLVEYRKV